MKNSILKYMFGLASLLLLALPVQAADLDLSALEASGLENLNAPGTEVISSGQPTQAQLQAMAAAGVKHVVNLRTPEEEIDYDEKAAVEALGMQYHSIPVAGAAGINNENALKLEQVLSAAAGEPVLVHCRTGNRVGGLMAVSHFNANGNLDAAMAEGERYGMTMRGLQSAVRSSLESQ